MAPRLSLAAVLASAAVATGPAPPSGVNQTLAKLFSLFRASCDTWANAWETDGAFLHPAFMEGVFGQVGLQQLCLENQASDMPFKVRTGTSAPTAFHSQFRQDGPGFYTESGGIHTLLVPFLSTTLRKQPDNATSHFSHTGWELVQMRKPATATAEYKFTQVAEFWSGVDEPQVRGSPNSRPAPPSGEIVDAVEKLFSLFQAPSCATWAESWTTDGLFLHPAFPGGLKGQADLFKMCEDNQAGDRKVSVLLAGDVTAYRSQFRLDGPYTLTESGNLYNLIFPYVYTSVRAQPDGSFSDFANSGWEFAQLQRQVDGTLKFKQVVEFWTRTRQPFENSPDEVKALTGVPLQI